MTQLSHPVTAITPAPPLKRWPKPLRTALVLRRFLRGWQRACRAGAAPEPETVADLQRLFRLTNGRFHRAAGWTARLHRPRRAFAGPRGILGELDRTERRRIRDDFRIAGVCEFDAILPEERCARLRMLARRWPCRVTPRPPGDARLRFDPAAQRGTHFTIDPPARVYAAPDVQQIIADESILTAAQAMLGCRPVFCGATMRWRAAGDDMPETSRFGHAVEHIRAARFVTYLTDVDADRGPHVFILGSQIDRPHALLEDRRFSETEMQAHYDAERIFALTGAAGTIFAEDSTGFHGDASPVTGPRLTLEFVFSTHALAAGLDAIPLPSVQTPEFRRAIERYPSVFRHFRKFGS